MYTYTDVKIRKLWWVLDEQFFRFPLISVPTQTLDREPGRGQETGVTIRGKLVIADTALCKVFSTFLQLVDAPA